MSLKNCASHLAKGRTLIHYGNRQFLFRAALIMIQDSLREKFSEELHSVRDHIKYITMAGNLLDFGSKENSTSSPEVVIVRIFLKTLGISSRSASSE
jgi:hypothetical protein